MRTLWSIAIGVIAFLFIVDIMTTKKERKLDLPGTTAERLTPRAQYPPDDSNPNDSNLTAEAVLALDSDIAMNKESGNKISRKDFDEPDVAPAQATPAFTSVNVFQYDHVIRVAIRAVVGAYREELSFELLPTYQRIAPPVYERKYPVYFNTEYGTTVHGYGYAQVKYKGGNADDINNWEILNSYIDFGLVVLRPNQQQAEIGEY